MVDTKRYNDWFDMAQKDLSGAKILFEHGADNSLVSFHCQQAVEKYLKGYLIYKTGMLSEGHNLLKLCKKCMEFDKNFSNYLKDSTYLNAFYIETRYPAEDVLTVTEQDAQECIQIAENIINFINKLIK